MNVRCPVCGEPNAVVEDTDLSDVTCRSCGESFDVVGDATASLGHQSIESIAHFELVNQVGAGAFGTVWKAWDSKLKRTVAIKIPRRVGMTDLEAAQFEREAQSAAQLRHSNIVAVHEVGRIQSQSYIVSEYIDGVSLASWLTGQRLSNDEAVDICMSIATALQHAHEKGVIHRDLKPANILLDRESKPYIADFGLAKRDTGELTLTIEGRVLGTPAYMSPEQARGDAHRADRRSDIYSLGAILFELLTGERPFRGDTRMLIHQVINKDPPKPRSLRQAIPADLENICLKCLDKSPELRYQSAADFATDLRRWKNGEPVTARPLSRLSKSIRWCHRNPRESTLIGLLLITVMSGLGLVTWQWIRANGHLKQAQKNAQAVQAQKHIADQNAEEAREIVDEFFTKVSQERLLKVPRLEPLRKELLQSALEFYSSFIERNRDNEELMFDLAQAYANVAMIEFDIGVRADAEPALRKSNEILHELELGSEILVEVRTRLGRNQMMLGHLAADDGKQEESFEHYRDAVEILESIEGKLDHFTESNLPLALLWLSHGYNYLGKLSESELTVRRAIALQMRIVDEEPTTKNRSVLCSCWHALGMTQQFDRRPADAAMSYHEAINSRSQLLSDSNLVENDRVIETSFLAQNYAQLGTTYILLEDFESARDQMILAVKFESEARTANPEITDYAINLCKHHQVLGRVLCRLGDINDGVTQFDASAELLREIVAEQSSAGLFYYMLADVLAEKSRYLTDEDQATIIECTSESIENLKHAIGHEYISDRQTLEQIARDPNWSRVVARSEFQLLLDKFNPLR